MFHFSSAGITFCVHSTHAHSAEADVAKARIAQSKPSKVRRIRVLYVFREATHFRS